MSSLKQVSRLVNGLSLVAKEIAKRSPALEAATSGDLQAFAKRAVLSATDISGLTKGKVRKFKSTDLTTDDRQEESSVVYFDHSPPAADVAVASVAQEESENEMGWKREEGNESENAVVSGLRMETAGNEGVANVAVTEEEEKRENVVKAVEVKRRKPREKRVPSTPFSRAIGCVFVR